MGNLRITIEGQELELNTPFENAAQDETILGAIKKAVTIKAEAEDTRRQELNADHLAELAEKEKELRLLREPLESDLVLASLAAVPERDPEKEKEFFSGLPTDRVLLEHSRLSVTIKPNTQNESVPGLLSNDGQVNMI